MASVFKRGKRWYARFKNVDGNWEKELGFTDKSATMQLAIKREHESDLVRKGLMDPPQAHRDRLIADDLTAFRSALTNKDVSDDHVDLVVGRCERLAEGCGFEKAADIEPIKVEEWLAGKRKDAKKKRGMSVQTSNHYLRAIKQLTRWLNRHKRLRTDPLIHLEMLNVAVDRRHDRRALSDDEVSRILAAAKNGGDVLGFSPADRHMLYVMALSTGLRASELASLRPESLLLLENPPTVTVKAGYSKRRRMDVLPLPAEILEAVRLWLASKPAGQPLWPGDWAEHRYAGKILQVDLLAANVDYVDANGLFADFHALRHTFITNLGRHGVPLVAAQKLARHSTPVLTAARYTHIDLADQSREVQKLPRLLGTNMGQTGGISCPKASTDGNENAAGLPGENTRKPAAILIKMQRRGGDSNPRSGCPDSGFQDRCNRPLCHLSEVHNVSSLLTFWQPRSTGPVCPGMNAVSHRRTKTAARQPVPDD
jgi:integrase/recombinase XerD